MNTPITVTHNRDAQHTVPFWFRNEQYWASRQMFIEEFNLIREAIRDGILPFAD